MDRVQTTGEKAGCLHDATSAFDHEDNLDGQIDKQGHTRMDRAAIYATTGGLLIRKNLRWTGHFMRISPDRLPTQIYYSQLSSGHRERARPSSPVRGYRLVDITLTAEKNGEQ